jgi:hypothetical protein
MKGTKTVSLCVRFETCRPCFCVTDDDRTLSQSVTVRQGQPDACPIVVTRDIRDLTRPV